MKTKKVKILFFGILREAAGKQEMILNDINDSETLQNHLVSLIPGLKDYTFRLAINQEFIDSNCTLKEGDIVAVMPPFAGG
ncbi:MAG: MoaD/ThiS family protein [Candidatus Neomarinimicrobiota bacterium]|jgi:molybdopterin synthase sulfur carrier subunit